MLMIHVKCWLQKIIIIINIIKTDCHVMIGREKRHIHWFFTQTACNLSMSMGKFKWKISKNNLNWWTLIMLIYMPKCGTCSFVAGKCAFIWEYLLWSWTSLDWIELGWDHVKSSDPFLFYVIIISFTFSYKNDLETRKRIGRNFFLKKKTRSFFLEAPNCFEGLQSPKWKDMTRVFFFEKAW